MCLLHQQSVEDFNALQRVVSGGTDSLASLNFERTSTVTLIAPVCSLAIVESRRLTRVLHKQQQSTASTKYAKASCRNNKL